MNLDSLLLQRCCQLRKKTNATGTKSTFLGIGCLVTLPSSCQMLQEKVCILTKFLNLPQLTLSRECFAVFYKDKKILLKPDRFWESCPTLGFTLIACEQAKIVKDDHIKPFPLNPYSLVPGEDFLSIKLNNKEQMAHGTMYSSKRHVVSCSFYSSFLFSLPEPPPTNTSSALKACVGGPMTTLDGKKLVGIHGDSFGSGININSVLHRIAGFLEVEGSCSILQQLDKLQEEDIDIDKSQLRVKACQVLSKIAANNAKEIEDILSYQNFQELMLSLPGKGVPNTGVVGACCKLLTILTSPQIRIPPSQKHTESIVSYVLSAMSRSQHATIHLFGCRVLLNLITCEEDSECYDGEVDVRTLILDHDGPAILRKVTRSHRDDKHIQHTVCLILSLLLEYTFKGWQESEDYRAHCITELQQANTLLSKAGEGLKSSQISSQRTEAEFEQKLNEKDKAIKHQTKVIENRESTIEQLQRELEYTTPPIQKQNELEKENTCLKETLEKERQLWEIQRNELSSALDFTQDLVKDMSTALRQIKTELENTTERLEGRKVEYQTWGHIKDELDRISKSLGILGGISAQELMYRYDMVDVAQDEDKQLRKSVEKTPDKVEKSELLRKFQRTHSQSSLDITVDTEQKATKTLDKIQMIRKAIHNLEETLELEEEKIEELRRQRFIVPRQQSTTNTAQERHASAEHEVDIRNLPRGLLKHLCRMLDEGPRCAWREIVPLLGMGHRLSELESSIDSPTGDLINMWVSENVLVTFGDFCEVLRLADLPHVLEFVTRHAQLKKRLSKQSLVFYPME